MNYLDMQRAVDKIEMRWGPTKSWMYWEALTEDFQNFSAGAFMEALEMVYRSGQRYAPSPSEMMKRCSEVQTIRIDRGVDVIPDDCRDNHVWADSWPTDEDRRRACVRCGETGALGVCEHLVVNRFRVCAYCLEKANV